MRCLVRIWIGSITVCRSKKPLKALQIGTWFAVSSFHISAAYPTCFRCYSNFSKTSLTYHSAYGVCTVIMIITWSYVIQSAWVISSIIFIDFMNCIMPVVVVVFNAIIPTFILCFNSWVIPFYPSILSANNNTCTFIS